MHEREINSVTNFRIRVGVSTMKEMNNQGISSDVKDILQKYCDSNDVIAKLNQHFDKQKFYFEIINRPNGSYLQIKGMLQ